MEKGTAGNTRGQLVASGVWVQVAEIFKTGQKIQKPHVSEKKKHVAPDKEEKKGVECTGG
jgi:hypothetical protein